MKTIEELTSTIAKNITTYRKKKGLTQLQLAELISYSDKAISKWEKGLAIPDVFVLSQLSEIFEVTLDELTSEYKEKKQPQVNKDNEYIKKKKNINKVVITILSSILVWFVFIITYVLLELTNPNTLPTWLLFIYALPVMFIVQIVFAKLWGKRWMRFITITGLTWTLTLSIHLTILESINLSNSYLLYLIAAAFQVLVIFWYFLKRKK